jgi:hypothetical protein
MTTVLNEVEGKRTNLSSFTAPLPYCGTTNPSLTLVFGQPDCISTPGPYYSNPTTHNFEPRIGFAWDPRNDGKMAIRGGYAIFDILPLPGYYYTQQGIETPFFLNGVIKTQTSPLPGTFGILANQPGSAFIKFGPQGLRGSLMESNPKRNYVQQWNLNVQRQITPSLTDTIGYVGSHGVHMIICGDDGDMVIPTLTSPGWLWPYNPILRINPNFGAIRFMTFGTDSSYEALQISVQKRMSHGFQLGASYTYSKALDSSSATIAGDAYSNSITRWFWFAPQSSHSISDFHVPHSTVINAIWQVPVPQSFRGPLKAALGGGETGRILKLNNGIPTTPIIAGDPLGVENSGSDAFSIPSRVPDCDPINHNFKSNPGGVFLGYVNTSCYTVPMATPAIASECVPFPRVPGSCSNLLGNAGRNSIIGPSLVDFDFPLYKNIPVTKIREGFNAQFRAEFFNILNRANFAPPLPFQGCGTAALFNQNGTPSGGGGLSNLTTQLRDIQFALKVIF